jgi:hypothetical protein
VGCPSTLRGDVTRCNEGRNPLYQPGLGQEWRMALIRHYNDFELATAPALRSE